MKNISLLFAGFLIAASVSAQNTQSALSGYMPFHQYLQQSKNGIRNNSSVTRDINVYTQIAYLHDIYLNSIDAWIYADSGTYTYNPNNAFQTGGNVVESINYNSAWADSTQFTNGFNANGYLLYSVTGQAWDNGINNWRNSYYDTFTYNLYFPLTQTYEAWDTIANTWDNVSQYIYTYDSVNLPTTEVQQQWVSSAWQSDTQFLYTYNAQNQLTQKITQLNTGGNSWSNYLKQNYTYDGNGNNNFIYESSWNGTAWVNLDLIYKSFNTFNSVISYDISVYDSANGTYDSVTYQESYLYDYRDDLVQFENYNWNTGAWAPDLQYTYTYDDNSNCLSEFDAVYSGDTLNNTDQYFYYYNEIQVSGINEIQNALNASVFPNPVADNSLSLSLTVASNDVVTMNIYDVSGKLISTDNRLFSTGANTMQVALPELTAGNYYLQLLDRSDGTSGVLKFIKN